MNGGQKVAKKQSFRNLQLELHQRVRFSGRSSLKYYPVIFIFIKIKRPSDRGYVVAEGIKDKRQFCIANPSRTLEGQTTQETTYCLRKIHK